MNSSFFSSPLALPSKSYYLEKYWTDIFDVSKNHALKYVAIIEKSLQDSS